MNFQQLSEKKLTKGFVEDPDNSEKRISTNPMNLNPYFGSGNNAATGNLDITIINSKNVSGLSQKDGKKLFSQCICIGEESYENSNGSELPKCCKSNVTTSNIMVPYTHTTQKLSQDTVGVSPSEKLYESTSPIETIGIDEHIGYSVNIVSLENEQIFFNNSISLKGNILYNKGLRAYNQIQNCKPKSERLLLFPSKVKNWSKNTHKCVSKGLNAILSVKRVQKFPSKQNSNHCDPEGLDPKVIKECNLMKELNSRYCEQMVCIINSPGYINIARSSYACNLYELIYYCFENYGRMPLNLVKKIMRDTLRGLRYLHKARGIAHGNITLINIMINIPNSSNEAYENVSEVIKPYEVSINSNMSEELKLKLIESVADIDEKTNKGFLKRFVEEWFKKESIMRSEEYINRINDTISKGISVPEFEKIKSSILKQDHVIKLNVGSLAEENHIAKKYSYFNSVLECKKMQPNNTSSNLFNFNSLVLFLPNETNSIPDIRLPIDNYNIVNNMYNNSAVISNNGDKSIPKLCNNCSHKSLVNNISFRNNNQKITNQSENTASMTTTAYPADEAIKVKSVERYKLDASHFSNLYEVLDYFEPFYDKILNGADDNLTPYFPYPIAIITNLEAASKIDIPNDKTILSFKTSLSADIQALGKVFRQMVTGIDSLENKNHMKTIKCLEHDTKKPNHSSKRPEESLINSSQEARNIVDNENIIHTQDVPSHMKHGEQYNSFTIKEMNEDEDFGKLLTNMITINPITTWSVDECLASDCLKL